MRKIYGAIAGLVVTCSIYGGPVSASVALFAAMPSTAHESVAAIPDDYFEKVELGGIDIFDDATSGEFVLLAPRLGTVTLVRDELRFVDLNKRILKWTGHIKDRADMKATFTRNLRGMVEGTIDTPGGRLLLGQLGDYVLYKEAKDSAFGVKPLAAVFDYDSLPPPTVTPPARYAYPVNIGIPTLSNAKTGDVISVQLPGPVELNVTKDTETAGQFGASTFVGHLTDFGDDFRLLVTYSASGVEGRLLTPQGEFLIRTLEGRTWLVDVERSGLVGAMPAMLDALVPDVASSAAPMTMDHSAARHSLARSLDGSSDTSGTKTKIDLLVVYTAGMLTAYKDLQGALTRIQYLVAAANQAYIDSGISQELNLVAAIQHPGPDDSDNTGALRAMTNAATPFESIKSSRSQYGADLVALIRPFSWSQGGSCGVAWVSGYNLTNVSFYAEAGYAVVSDLTIQGQRYCSDYVLAHELGHNMGAMHDRTTVQQQGGGVGAYNYAFGYSATSKFGTIMSYQQPYVGKFSNPNISCSGEPCGVAETSTSSSNNALALNNTRSAVAAFRASLSNPTSFSLSGVVSVNGVARSGATITATPSLSCTTSASNGMYSCTATSGWTGTLKASLAGYTFSPTTLSIPAVGANISGLNFQGASTSSDSSGTTTKTPTTQPKVARISISGKIVFTRGKVSGVTIQSTGGAACSAVSANGSYTCSMNSGWSGSIVPVARGKKFSPAGVTARDLRSSYRGINFYAK